MSVTSSSTDPRVRTWTAGLLLLVSILVPESARSSTPSAARAGEDVTSGFESITSIELLGHIKYLADDALEGRASGTEGERQAAAYIAKQFELYGLEPVGVDGSYFQPITFPMPARTVLGPGNRLESRGAVESDFPVETTWVPFSFSPTKEAEGTLVFAGYGIQFPEEEYDDYKPVDVTGKVVLVLRRSPGERIEKPAWANATRRLGAFTSKIRVAQEQGAAAVIVVNDSDSAGPDGQDELYHLSNSVRARGIEIPAIFAKRSIAAAWLKTVGVDLDGLERRIDEELTPVSMDLPEIRVRVATELAREEAPAQPTQNVVGLLPGSDPRLGAECVILGAHYDHVGLGHFGSLGRNTGEIHNGADDNASGTAGLLEIAQALSLAPQRPRRSVLFIAFAAEERGLWGSKRYVEHPLIDLDQTMAMINLDMIGRSADGSVEVSGVGTSPGFEADLARWNEAVGLTLAIKKAYEPNSDHAPFAGKGVPILFLFSGLHPDYHRPTDDWEKIEADNASRIARLTYEAISDLADREERIPFTEATGGRGMLARLFGGESRSDRSGPLDAAGTPSSRPTLGVQLDPDAPEGPGVMIGSVLKGGPAERCDLRAGDRITAINGRPVRSMEDLLQALDALDPAANAGDLDIEIIRKVSVKVGRKE